MSAENNGHHTVKVEGKTLFPGPLEALPYPERMPTTEEAVSALFDDGYVIFPGLLSKAEVAELKAGIDSRGNPDDSVYDVPGWCYNKHLGLEFHKDPYWLKFIDREPVLSTVEDVHGGDAHLGFASGAQVVGGSVWVTGAGRAMGIHTDYQSYGVGPEVHDHYRMPIYCSTLHYYLNDLVPEHGPTILIPGSHRAGRYPNDEHSWNGISPRAGLVKAGDAILFRNDLWHGAWKNTHETERRYIMQIHYAHPSFGKCYPSLRWPETYAPEVLEVATPRQRQLLGEWPKKQSKESY